MPDTWAFVAVVYKRGEVMLYADGTTLTGPAAMGPGRGALRIGGADADPRSGFPGLIDHAFVYDVALTVTELDRCATFVTPSRRRRRAALGTRCASTPHRHSVCAGL